MDIIKKTPQTAVKILKSIDYKNVCANVLKWDHFKILILTGRSIIHCKIKDTILITDLKPALNDNVGKVNDLYYLCINILQQTCRYRKLSNVTTLVTFRISSL